MSTWPTGTERPVRNRTPKSLSAWVARSSSVSPAEQAGALPFHDTSSTAGIDWTFTPTRPPTRTFAPVNADNREADPPGRSPVVDLDNIDGVIHLTLIRATWSLALSGAALWLVWVVGRVSAVSNAVVTATLLSIVVCGGLLMMAHGLTSRRNR